MALTRLTHDQYGQVELNNVAFRRDGRIEAQCALDSSWTATKPCENGMIVAVNKDGKEHGGVVVAYDSAKDYPLALVYSTEHTYDERYAGGLKYQYAVYDEKGNYFYPRLGYLAVGDSFTTNTVCYDDGDYATETALATAVAAGSVYGVPDATGAIKLTATKAASGLCLKALAMTTMPDGQKAVKFHVYAD